MKDLPHLGHGVALRRPHYVEVLTGRARVGWIEVIVEDVLEAGGNRRQWLRRLREEVPVVLHGASLALGCVEPLDRETLWRVATLVREIEPAWLSEHIAWGPLRERRAHDLGPLPCTEEVLEHMAMRVRRVQDQLGRRLLLENVPTYPCRRRSAMPEQEFVSRLLERADCGLLLDLNNLHASARNHRVDPLQWLDAIPNDRVGQIHLEGNEEGTEHLWHLYRAAVARFGRIATAIEWDERLPPLDRVIAESRRAAAVQEEVLRAAA